MKLVILTTLGAAAGAYLFVDAKFAMVFGGFCFVAMSFIVISGGGTKE